MIRFLLDTIRTGSAASVAATLRCSASVTAAQRASGWPMPPAERDCGRGHLEPEVRLLVDGDAPALSDEAEAILARLRRTGRIRLDVLVREAAESLYRSELSRGGAGADLGLLGPAILEPTIRSALDAGCGRLWEIRPLPPTDTARAEGGR